MRRKASRDTFEQAFACMCGSEGMLRTTGWLHARQNSTAHIAHGHTGGTQESKVTRTCLADVIVELGAAALCL